MFKTITGSVFILNAMIFFFQALTKHLFPPLLLPLKETFLLDNTEAGLLVSLVFFGYALARFPSGILADIYGCTKTVLLGSVTMALSFMAIAFSPNYTVLALITFILGVSSGIYVTAGYTLAVIIGSREKATTATAAFEIFGGLSGLISPALVTFFVLFFDWQLLFAFVGLGLAAVTFIFYLKREKSAAVESQFATSNGIGIDLSTDLVNADSQIKLSKNLFGEIKRSLAVFKSPLIRRFIIWSTLVGGLGALSWTGINSFLPTFLVEIRGYSYEVANHLFIIVALAGVLAKLVTGWLADRYGNNPVLFVNLLLSVMFFMILTLVASHWQVIVTLLLIGVVCYNTNTLINAHVLRNMPPRYQGAGFGLFCTAYTVIYSAGPYLTGFLSDQYGLITAIRLSSIGAVLAALLILAARWLFPDDLVREMTGA